MLTPLRPTPFRTALLSLALAVTSLAAFPVLAYAGPCDAAPGGGLGCNAEGENPGNPGNPGGPNNNGGETGNNNGPGTGPNDNGGGQLLPGVEGDNAPAEPDTEDTIAKAFAQIEFPIPTIETAPEPKTFVRVRTSFWIPAAEAEDITVQASVGEEEGVQPQTITATAKLEYVLWKLVDDEMTCKGPGRPNGEGPGEECDHYFKTSSAYHGMDAFEIEAIPHWSITWTCTGSCPDGEAGIVDDNDDDDDDYYASPAGEIELVVDEIQTEAKDN